MQKYKYPHMQLAICDDGTEDRKIIRQMVEKVLLEQQVSATISCYASAAELLEAIQAGQIFHILLLDVLMDDMDGIALAAVLRAQDVQASIIFISSSQEMALRGYEVAAVRYLAKPVQEEKLREAILFSYKAYQKERALLLPTPKGQTRIKPSSILCAESQERNVVLTLSSGQMIANIKISELAAMLPAKQYVFCHRTVLVNLAQVEHIRPNEVELKSGLRLPISRHRLAELRAQFLHYLDAAPK